MDVSGRVLRAWMPAIHAGMTETADGRRRSSDVPPFSSSVGERKLMNHFVIAANTTTSILLPSASGDRRHYPPSLCDQSDAQALCPSGRSFSHTLPPSSTGSWRSP